MVAGYWVRKLAMVLIFVECCRLLDGPLEGRDNLGPWVCIGFVLEARVGNLWPL